ncbi:hypothetical protein O4H52_22255, partial [Sphingomonadaceae bacterium G21617-S1]|nr:hypothetical protein [Sphingomonadaceae bacterium G21617-S1]
NAGAENFVGQVNWRGVSDAVFFVRSQPGFCEEDVGAGAAAQPAVEAPELQHRFGTALGPLLCGIHGVACHEWKPKSVVSFPLKYGRDMDMR